MVYSSGRPLISLDWWLLKDSKEETINSLHLLIDPHEVYVMTHRERDGIKDEDFQGVSDKKL